MQFLTPLYLLGALAIGGPIAAHLIRKVSKKYVPFSSLMFLEPTPPTLKSPRHIDRWPLLLLRCLAVLLFVFAFARPFVLLPKEEQAALAEEERVLILLDASASMRRDGFWEQAVSAADQAAVGLGQGSEAALWLFGDQVQPLLSFDAFREAQAGQRQGLVSSLLDQQQPGWSGSALAAAMQAAAGHLADQAADDEARGVQPTRQRVVVISDFQQGVQALDSGAVSWPKGVDWAFETVGADGPVTNAGIAQVQPADAGDQAVIKQVRITNAAGGQGEQFAVSWANANGEPIGKPVPAYVPVGQARVFPLPETIEGDAANRLVLTGDDHAFDNHLYIGSHVVPEVTLWALGADRHDPNRGLYFLDQAVLPTADYLPTLHTTRPDQDPSLIWFAEAISPSDAEAVHALVRGGATAWVMAHDESMVLSLAAVLGQPAVAVTNVNSHQSANNQQSDAYAMLGEMNTQHAVLKPFSDPRFADFTAVRIWRHTKIDLSQVEATVLLKLDDGTPVMWSVGVGKGRVLINAFGWASSQSQLAVSTKFVPLVHSVIQTSLKQPSAPSHALVGDPVRLPAAMAGGRVTTPDGQGLVIAENSVFIQTHAPGNYQAAHRGEALRFAVNLNPQESKTTPLTQDDREASGLAPTPGSGQTLSQANSAATDAQGETSGAGASGGGLMASGEAEAGQKYWRWLIALVLGGLLIETLWAGRRAVPAASFQAVDTGGQA